VICERQGVRRISDDTKRRIIELDHRYRSTWDACAIAHVIGVGKTSVAEILREARGPRPQPFEYPHDRRTRFTRVDVMYSSDFVRAAKGRLFANTTEEAAFFGLGWDLVRSESAKAAKRHGEGIIEKMDKTPLVWKFDLGGGFNSAEFMGLLDERQILPYPLPPRAPWVQGRVERGHRDVRNWLIPVDAANISDEELEKEFDEGYYMFNFVKPRTTLGYKTSAEIYHTMQGVEDIDREALRRRVDELKCSMQKEGGGVWRIHRSAIRQALQELGLYEEWQLVPKGAETVNRLARSYVAF
jgi:transposase InsO family protein